MHTTKILFILFLGCITIHAQSEIYDITEVKIKKSYNQISPLAKYRYDSISYEEARNQKAYIFEKFKYKSDAFEVEGFSCRPQNVGNQKIPVIVYNRGGTGNFGRLSEEDFPDFYWLAKHGFAVYATNYRFVGTLGAVDQIGGDDVNDVINLYKAVKNLDFVDRANMFMMGVSRGGQMTYQSLRKINLNAAAVIGGVADFKLQVTKRPIFITGWSDLDAPFNYKGLENILPNFKQYKEKYFSERSATNWADELNTPLYILHSRQDGRVSVEGIIKLIKELTIFNKEYKVKIYDEKSHSLPYSKFDSFTEIIHWFKRHMN